MQCTPALIRQRPHCVRRTTSSFRASSCLRLTKAFQSPPLYAQVSYTASMPTADYSHCFVVLRTALIECPSTGLVARIRFMPYRPQKDACYNIVIGSVGSCLLSLPATESLPAAHQSSPTPSLPPLTRRRSGDGSALAAALAAILPRRWSNTNMRRTLSGTTIPEEVDAAHTVEACPASEATTAPQSLTLYGLLDGKIFLSPDALPHRSASDKPHSSAAAVASARLLWDDARSGIPSMPLSNGCGDVICVAPVLKSPALMTNALLWSAVVDGLRTAVSERRVGAHPVTSEVLRAALQREGPQVTRAKAKAREEGKRTSMCYAASWMLASQPTTNRAPALEHAPPRMPRLVAAEPVPASLDAATSTAAATLSGAESRIA